MSVAGDPTDVSVLYHSRSRVPRMLPDNISVFHNKRVPDKDLLVVWMVVDVQSVQMQETLDGEHFEVENFRIPPKIMCETLFVVSIQVMNLGTGKFIP